MYGKIFSSMYDGSLYGNWQAIVTFQQMIVLCDQDGVLDMTPQALAARTSIPLDVIQEGIRVLEAPDQYSRSPDHDGRRIERLDSHRPWGWRIVNHRKYQRMVDAETVREQNRIRQQLKRERDKEEHLVTERDSHAASQVVTTSNESHAKSRHTDTDTDTDKKTTCTKRVLVTADDLVGDGIPRETAEEWLQVRKEKRARSLTPIAWEAVKREAAKAGWALPDAVRKCVERNWITFDAQYVAAEKPPSKPAKKWWDTANAVGMDS